MHNIIDSFEQKYCAGKIMSKSNLIGPDCMSESDLTDVDITNRITSTTHQTVIMPHLYKVNDCCCLLIISTRRWQHTFVKNKVSLSDRITHQSAPLITNQRISIVNFIKQRPKIYVKIKLCFGHFAPECRLQYLAVLCQRRNEHWLMFTELRRQSRPWAKNFH